ncbi:MAG: MerR family transcriptional regulator [bacterium]
MFEQLDLFGGEPSKPRETAKKKFALVPPQQVVEEPVTGIVESNPSKEIEPQIDESLQEITQNTYTADHVHAVQQNVEEYNIPATQLNPKEESVNNFTTESTAINIPEDATLYSKQYYAISEVASMFNVNISLLRFWEKEFDILKPRKNRKGDRLFRPDDIKNLKLIYFLLREKKYTIEGARTFIKKGKKVNEHFDTVEILKNIRKMLVELKESLS